MDIYCGLKVTDGIFGTFPDVNDTENSFFLNLFFSPNPCPLFFLRFYVILYAERYSEETASDDNVLSLFVEVIT